MKKIAVITFMPLLLTLTSCGFDPLSKLEKKLDRNIEDSPIPKAEKLAMVRDNIGFSIVHKYVDGSNTCYMYDNSISCVKNASQ